MEHVSTPKSASERNRRWASTMGGFLQETSTATVITAHADSTATIEALPPAATGVTRELREARERELLSVGATQAVG